MLFFSYYVFTNDISKQTPWGRKSGKCLGCKQILTFCFTNCNNIFDICSYLYRNILCLKEKDFLVPFVKKKKLKCKRFVEFQKPTNKTLPLPL